MIREGGGEGKAQLTHASGSQNKNENGLRFAKQKWFQQNKNGDSMIEIKMTTTQGRERGNKINNNNNIIYNNNIYNNNNTTTKPMFVFYSIMLSSFIILSSILKNNGRQLYKRPVQYQILQLHSFWQTEEVKPIPGQRLGYRGGQIDPRLTPGFVANGNL